MTTYVAFLRAVNVGGTGKLPMRDLKAICAGAGFANVETYIASGNVIFDSKAGAATVKAQLERRLKAYAGKPLGVVLRTKSELAAVLKGNPFPKAPPKFTAVLFLNERLKKDALDGITGVANEEFRAGAREIYVYYPDGMGRSKLKIPAAKSGTARNLNTVAALVEMTQR